MNKTFSIKTLGCKFNQYESAVIADSFVKKGWHPVPFGQKSDIVIINTCTVTDRSDKKCRNYIRQGAKFSLSGGAVVTGCLAERDIETVRQMPEVLAAFGNSEKEFFYERVISAINSNDEYKDINIVSASPENAEEIHMPAVRTRKYVKIQSGCDGACTYCIVPSVRGIPLSRSREDIINHAEKLIESGCPEIVLTGITIGKYSDKGHDLAGLLESLIRIQGEFRIRITSIEPNHVSDRLLELYTSEKVCNHIHLPLQSGSPLILDRMNRPYTCEDYISVVERIRSVNPDIAIGTDLIVGFPGETEKEFQESINLIKYVEFPFIHQFTFSPRSGTPAALMKQNATEHEISDRAKRVKEIALEKSLLYRRGFEGRILETVIEHKKQNEEYSGISDNYIRLKIQNTGDKADLSGKICRVKLVSVTSSVNTAVLCDQQES